MGLPLEQTTPLTEVIESTVKRITETLETLGPLAEKAVSDATRSTNPDTSMATTTINAAHFWTTYVEQMALGLERAAGNMVLLTHDEVPVVEWVTQSPIIVDGSPPEAGWTFRVASLVSSEGRAITDREVTFTRLDGQAVDRSHPVLADDWDHQLLARIRTWGWVPTGPIAGVIQPVVAGKATRQAVPVYCALG